MTEYWRISKLWPGETVVIIAGGPSLTAAQVRLVGMARTAGKVRVIAINDAVYLAWWADWLHACDRLWWSWHPGVAEQFAGIKTALETVDGVHTLNNTGRDGFDPEPTNCRTGANSAYQAMHCAIHAGVRKIILIGVDMSPGPDGRIHWFGDHPAPRSVDYQSVMIPCFVGLADAITERGIKVVNATPLSALNIYPYVELEKALEPET